MSRKHSAGYGEAVETMRNAFRPEVSRLLTQFFDEQEAAAVSAVKVNIGDWLSNFGALLLE